MAWVQLVLAGMLEICWAVGLRYTDGFRRLGPSLFVLATLAGSMLLLASAVRSIPIGTAYAIWVGIGALGAAIFGIAILNEPASTARIVWLVVLVLAIVGLKQTSS